MKKPLMLFVLIVMNSLNLFPQWQPDVRLTNNSSFSLTSYNSNYVASIGNIVHVVWRDNRDGDYEIYYKRSTDGGLSWESDTRLTNDPFTSRNPCISVSGSMVHVFWSDERDGGPDIYYKRSSDSGVSWGADTQISNGDAFCGQTSSSADGLLVSVVWEDYRDLNQEIYFNHSSDGGLSWGTESRLTNNPATSWTPSLAEVGSVLHLVWRDERDGNNEIYYKRSTDGGSNWGEDFRLTNDPAFSYGSSVSVSDSFVAVVWVDDRDGNNEIYYKYSTDDGSNWGMDTRLTSNTSNSNNPKVLVSDLTTQVVWTDDRDGNTEIYHNRSTDGGISWEADSRLTNNIFESDYPSFSISDSTVHLVWNDNRDGNYEIYYKRNTSGVTGVETISSELPEDFILNQNYPNPFNPSTTISFSISNEDFVSLNVFNSLGKKVSELVSETKPAGNYSVSFDASALSSGVYFYTISAGNFIQTRKMILVK